MIKSNTKKAIENIRGYIMRAVDTTGYDIDIDTKDYKQVCKFIMNEFRTQKGHEFFRGYGSIQNIFESWCAGLPSCFDTSYYYNVSAVDLVGTWLEETEEEKARYTETQAENIATALLYRELLKGDK